MCIVEAHRVWPSGEGALPPTAAQPRPLACPTRDGRGRRGARHAAGRLGRRRRRRQRRAAHGGGARALPARRVAHSVCRLWHRSLTLLTGWLRDRCRRGASCPLPKIRPNVPCASTLCVLLVHGRCTACARHAHGIMRTASCALQASFGHSVVEIEVMCTSPDEVAAAERVESWSAHRLSRHATPLSSGHTHSSQQPGKLQQPTSSPTACETGNACRRRLGVARGRALALQRLGRGRPCCAASQRCLGPWSPQALGCS